jgi:DNA-binding NarL/FixJ family response regulator
VRVRVLVVDDSAAVRARLVELLREAGIVIVGEANNAADALLLARALVPDAVVLDLQLPDRNGVEVLAVLKREQPSVVVVILTNAAHGPYRRRCLELGAAKIFDKSSDFDAVAPALASLFDDR